MDKHCGNCGWYAKGQDADDDFGIEELGDCGWPEHYLPHSMRWAGRERVWVGPGQGTECACWIPQKTEK